MLSVVMRPVLTKWAAAFCEHMTCLAVQCTLKLPWLCLPKGGTLEFALQLLNIQLMELYTLCCWPAYWLKRGSCEGATICTDLAETVQCYGAVLCQLSSLAVTVNVGLFAEVDDNRMHPARSAPRCLPCNYQDPLQGSSSSNEFNAPQVRSGG